MFHCSYSCRIDSKMPNTISELFFYRTLEVYKFKNDTFELLLGICSFICWSDLWSFLLPIVLILRIRIYFVVYFVGETRVTTWLSLFYYTLCTLAYKFEQFIRQVIHVKCIRVSHRTSISHEISRAIYFVVWCFSI